MPFEFLRRGRQPTSAAGENESAGEASTARPTSPAGRTPSVEATPGAAVAAARRGIAFDGLTEDWRLSGTMHVEGRLSDALNRREAISISDVRWGPSNGSGPMEPAPGLRSIDPYDLIAVLAGPDTQPALTDEEKAARKVRKEAYEVVLEAPPFRIVGTLHVFPGSSTGQLMDQTAEMFVPLTDAVAYAGDAPVAEPGVKVVLVNRLYVRRIEQTGR